MLPSRTIEDDPHMAFFPLELQVTVVEWVYRHSQSQSDIDYITLRACALVCRAWRPIAQRLLFRRVPRQMWHMDESRFYVSMLIDILRTRPHLAAHVRSIYLAPDPVDIALLELCPHVAGITVDIVEDNELSRMRSLAIPQDWTQHVQYFNVIDFTDGIASIWKMWPGLRAIDIGVFMSPDTLIRVPSGVTALCFPSQVMSWIDSPHDSLSALRDLELYEPKFPDLCASGLLPQLRTLVLHGPLPRTEVLEQLQQLESLVFNDLPVHDISLPRALRHVGYHYEPNSYYAAPSQKDVSFFVAALRVLDDIELVTVTRLNLLAKTQLALREACREMDVEFLTYETPLHFARPRCVDWI
ncbi:hypothetical protein FA95DRAFT_610973 [Auriscalpium vulgare]|uniref:Uncharacterized protein n=1 Tax=Auriscalpium vulgare TaxID=40419 RepID=A0ACB8RE51_9AGAM|nr:hypothetical protein FA95DRAFT_610973 [Auriscalpium vulgare]